MYLRISVAVAGVLGVACSGGDFESMPSGQSGSGGVGGSAGSASAGSGGSSAGSSSVGGAGGSPAGAGGSGAAAGGATGGSGGTGGSDGGSGGSPVECQSAADCSNGNPCDGAERCDLGICVPGTPVVCNAAPHCVSVCDMADGTCVVTAQDADGDGQGTTQCLEAPGMDCDDSNPDVYDGNPEVCDGFDNDCNGKADLFDGLTLGGAFQQLDAGSNIDDAGFDVAWSETSQQYAAAYVMDGSVRVRRFGASGAPVGSTTIVVSVGNDDGGIAAASPSIAWGGDRFGVVWEAKAGSAREVHYAGISADGTLLVGPMRITAADGKLSESPGIAWSGDHFFLVWEDSRKSTVGLRAFRIKRDGTPFASAGSKDLSSGTRIDWHPHIAVSGGVVGVSYARDALSGDVGFMRIADRATGIDVLTDVKLPGTTFLDQRVAATSSHFGITWDGPNGEAGGVHIVPNTGGAGCTSSIPSGRIADIGAVAGGFVYSLRDAGLDSLNVGGLDTSCAETFPTRQVPVPKTLPSTYALAVVGQSTGYGLVISDASSSESLHARAVTDLICK